MTLTAPASGQWVQNSTFNVIGTASAAVPTQSISLDLVLAPPPGSLPNNRTDYVRTDDTPQSIAYDPTHQFLYASESLLNRVDVVSTTSRQIVKSIPVVSPQGIALTPDGSNLLVGSNAQQIVSISTATLQVDNLWKVPGLPVVTFGGARRLYPLFDGTVAIQVAGNLIIWDPTHNTTSKVTLPPTLSQACYTSASGNGTNVIVADCGTSPYVAVYNVSTKTFPVSAQFTAVHAVAASPDGSKFLISDGTYGLVLYDSQLQQISLLSSDGSLDNFIFSSDGTHIYVAGPPIGVFDGTGNFLSTSPALSTVAPGVSATPYLGQIFAVDSTGIIFGAADHGVAFQDSTYSVTYIPGLAIPDQELTLTPSYGPVNATTQTQFPITFGFDAVPDVWFGNIRALLPTLGTGGSLSVTAPASPQPGPVNVKIMQPDGIQLFSPLVFSYGPTPMFVDGDSSTPNGGATSDIIGLGFPTNPSQMQVTVGSQSASVVSVTTPGIFGVTLPSHYPYPVVDIKITLPPGNGDNDIQITTPGGSATLSKAIHYVQNVTDYSSPDSFRAVLLDRQRNQLYLSAGDHIDVFSLSSKQFLAPFTPPALNGQKLFHGLALTPDSSTLLAANFSDGSLAVINPDQPGSASAVQIVPFGSVNSSNGPEYIGTTNTGKAFVELSNSPFSLYELDLSNKQVTAIQSPVQYGIFLAGSGDGSKLLLTAIGNPLSVAVYDSAGNAWSTNAGIGTNLGASAASSINASVLAIGSGTVDNAALFQGYFAWQDVLEYAHGQSVPLEKVPDGGSLVYIPYANSVDIFDINHGALLRRVRLTESVQSGTDAMAIDGLGESIYLTTDAGLTIVQLNTAPLAIGNVAPATGPPGTTVTIHGSGFQSGTSVAANNLAVMSTLVDANTLQFVMPNVATGPVQVTVTNPSGETYSLDNAFTAQ